MFSYHIQCLFWVLPCYKMTGTASWPLTLNISFSIQDVSFFFPAGRASCPAASLYSSLPPLVPAQSLSAQNRCLTSLHPRVGSGKRFLRGLDRVGRANTPLPSGEYNWDIR